MAKERRGGRRAEGGGEMEESIGSTTAVGKYLVHGTWYAIGNNQMTIGSMCMQQGKKEWGSGERERGTGHRQHLVGNMHYLPGT